MRVIVYKWEEITLKELEDIYKRGGHIHIDGDKKVAVVIYPFEEEKLEVLR